MRARRSPLLDINEDAAHEVGRRVIQAGGYGHAATAANVLEAEAPGSRCTRPVLEDLGPCDILINGAGGNNPARHHRQRVSARRPRTRVRRPSSTSDPAGVRLRLQAELHRARCCPPRSSPRTWSAARRQHPEHLLDERLHPADQDPRLLRREGRHLQLHPVAGRPLRQAAASASTPSPPASSSPTRTATLLFNPGRHPHRPHRQDPGRHPDGPLRRGGRAARRAALPASTTRPPASSPAWSSRSTAASPPIRACKLRKHFLRRANALRRNY